MVAPTTLASTVQALETSAEVIDAITRLGDATRFEVLSALPPGEYSAEMLRHSWDLDIAMLNRGVDLRVIYPAQAARQPDVMEYLTQFAARGARVRVHAQVPNRLVISDRVRAIVPEAPEAECRTLLYINGKVLVRALYSEFLEMWRASLPVGFSTGGLDVDMVRETLLALAEGQTDEASARKHGWSVRSYRRRIAAVLDLLGTPSRFEAGVLARQQGWL